MEKVRNWKNYTVKSLVFWVIAGIIAGVFCGYFLADRQDVEIFAVKSSENSALVFVTLPKNSDKSIELLLDKNSTGVISATTNHENGTYSALITSTKTGAADVIYNFNFAADTNMKKLMYITHESAFDGLYKIQGGFKLHINFGENGAVETLNAKSAEEVYMHHVTDAMGLGVKVKKGIDIFIWVLKILVGPIIFLTIILGIIGLESLKKVGSIGLKAFIYFEIVSTFALAIGILFGNFLTPGAGMNIDMSALDASSVTAAAVSGEISILAEVKTILKNAMPVYYMASENGWFSFMQGGEVVKGWIIPDPIHPFTEGKTLQVLVMALSLAMLISAFAGRFKNRILEPLARAQDFFFFILKLLMWFSPIAAFCAMSFLIGKFGIDTIVNMGSLLLVMLFSCLVFIFAALGLILHFFFKINIFKFMYYIHKEVLVVFATSSSESALGPLMRRLEQAGVGKGVTGLVVPTGYSFNLDCTNIYLALSIIFLSQATGVNLTLFQQLTILVILMITSKGAVGVTGSGFIVLAGTLQAVNCGIEPAAVAILLGVDKFMSEMRAVGNLCGNAVAAVVVG
ncbi:MAG: cation:dicarboxylase symporter family transporter, partial [Campylobacteraceae bacterium]|nr:cation:dicarboxylase symporter family transporter [Campylobacteraceae bacterium]